MAAQQDYIRFIFRKFRNRVELLKKIEIQRNMATRLQVNYRAMMLRIGKNVTQRNKVNLRNSATIMIPFTREVLERRASIKVSKFFRERQWRSILENHIIASREFVNYW